MSYLLHRVCRLCGRRFTVNAPPWPEHGFCQDCVKQMEGK